MGSREKGERLAQQQHLPGKHPSVRFQAQPVGSGGGAQTAPQEPIPVEFAATIGDVPFEQSREFRPGYAEQLQSSRACPSNLVVDLQAAPRRVRRDTVNRKDGGA